MSDLAEFLLARIADDEAYHDHVRRYTVSRGGSTTDEDGRDVQARERAECEAKRRIVELHRPSTDWSRECEVCATGAGLRQAGIEVDHEDWPCRTVRLLALPYADHPDYREEWRP